MKIFITLLSTLFLTACAGGKVLDEDESTESIDIVEAIAPQLEAIVLHRNSQADPCLMGLTVEQLDSMKADAQATFADMIKDCKRDQAFVDVIAKMQGMPTTDVGEVARELRLLVASVEETDAAEKRATADIAKTAIVGTVTLGTGLILGSAIEAAIDGAGHNSYTAGNISQSNSINGIEGEGINLNGGDRSNVVAFGEDMFIQDLDIRQDGDSPNALITNDSEKPNAQDGAGDSLYNDSLDGANNDTSLF